MIKQININNRLVGPECGTYFIADVAANHDGDLQRAKDLCLLAHRSGADAVKFQHFNAKTFVSDVGFKSLGGRQSHQASWDKSVYEIYEDASLPLHWTKELKEHCDRIGVTFFSSPYGLDMVDHLNPFVPAWKIGSGDINYHAQLRATARTGKPVMVATGASHLEEVISAIQTLQESTDKIILMQCNTNYTGGDENFDHINLRVLKTYRALFPDIILGLSDHTHGMETVLGAVALGARVVEKHFTDDNSRPGPDHPFSMTPVTWKQMVESTRILERSLGHGIKTIESNEKETVILQRRALCAVRDLESGTVLTPDMFEAKRPCPPDALNINHNLKGSVLRKVLAKDAVLKKSDIR